MEKEIVKSLILKKNGVNVDKCFLLNKDFRFFPFFNLIKYIIFGNISNFKMFHI